MRRISVAAVVLTVLGQASVVAADPIPIREAAERAAREVALKASAAATLQAAQSQRRRSVGRTVGGVILMGVGTPFLLAGLTAESIEGGSVCVNGDCLTVDVDTGGIGWGVAALGGGLVVTGALLASVWSDVPVVNSLDFTVTPHRVQVGKTFGF